MPSGPTKGATEVGLDGTASVVPFVGPYLHKGNCLETVFIVVKCGDLHHPWLCKPMQVYFTHPTLVAQWSCWSSLHHSLLNRCKCQCPLQWCWGRSECSPVSCCPPGLCWWSLWEVLPGPQPHCGARWWWREGSCPQCSWRRQGLGRSPLDRVRWHSRWEELCTHIHGTIDMQMKYLHFNANG